MPYLSEKICLVIPCHNEAKRLDFTKFEEVGLNCYFLFVNDGCKDDTAQIIKKHIKENMGMLNLASNVGKGEAIRRGMLYIKTLPIFEEIRWIGYWDADLATPLSELNNFILYSKLYNNIEIDAIWGSRISRLGSDIKRSYLRHILGRLFATLASFVLKVKCYDSQCGAKLFKKELLDIAFDKPFVSGWIFDVEILLRLDGYSIIEYPLRNWKDVAGSKINIPLIVPGVLRDVIKLGRIYKHKAII